MIRKMIDIGKEPKKKCRVKPVPASTFEKVADEARDSFGFKGTASTYNEIPKTGNSIGDLWYVADIQACYIWAVHNNKPQWVVISSNCPDKRNPMDLVETKPLPLGGGRWSSYKCPRCLNAICIFVPENERYEKTIKRRVCCSRCNQELSVGQLWRDWDSIC